MFWFVFAILAAFFHALYFALVKKFLKSINQFVLAFGTSLVTSLILFLISLINGVPQIGDLFFLSVIATTILNIFIIILSFEALAISDLSLSVPMLTFTPVFLIFTSFFILGEIPSIFGILGIFLITVGSYVLNISGKHAGFLGPIKNIFKNKGTLLMLSAAFLMSVSINFDKLVVVNSDAIFGSAIVYFLLAISFLIISITKKYKIKEAIKVNFNKLFIVGLDIALIAVFINLAYTLQIVSYAISIKRLSILFSVLLGALFFKEKNIPKRFLGVFIMLLGAIIIILF